MGFLNKNSSNGPWSAVAFAAGALGAAALLWPSDREKDRSEDFEGRGTNGSTKLAIKDFEQRRFERNRRAAKGLMQWAVANIGVGAVGALASTGRWKHFHELNMAWNAVSAVMMSLGYREVLRRMPLEDGAAREAIDAAHEVEEALRADAGISAACAGGGAYLWDYGQRNDSERLQGYGLAIILQSAVFVVLDSTLFLSSRRHRRNFEIKLSTDRDERQRPSGATLH